MPDATAGARTAPTQAPASQPAAGTADPASSAQRPARPAAGADPQLSPQARATDEVETETAHAPRTAAGPATPDSRAHGRTAHAARTSAAPSQTIPGQPTAAPASHDAAAQPSPNAPDATGRDATTAHAAARTAEHGAPPATAEARPARPSQQQTAPGPATSGTDGAAARDGDAQTGHDGQEHGRGGGERHTPQEAAGAGNRQPGTARRQTEGPSFTDVLPGLPDVPPETEAPHGADALEAPDADVAFSPEPPPAADAARAHGPARTAAPEGQPRAAAQTPAWLRATLTQALRSFSMDKGWKVLQMKLEEGNGTMTVRARRDDNGVSVAVNFTDPGLRAMAASNADRLHAALQAQYNTDVDFSLFSGDTGDPQQQFSGQSGDARTPSRGRGRGPGEAVGTAAGTADAARTSRAALAGARNEWIG